MRLDEQRRKWKETHRLVIKEKNGCHEGSRKVTKNEKCHERKKIL